MSSIIEQTLIKQTYDAGGELVNQEETKSTTKFKKNEEDEYIKIYTKMICVFQNLPAECAPLMLALASSMTYANINDTESHGGQLVGITQLVRENICKQLNISKTTFFRNIKKLEEANIIRKIGGQRSATYQINPEYFGKGLYEYSPQHGYGGIKDLRATFNFSDKKVHTEITYAGDYMTESEMYEHKFNKTEYTKTTTLSPGEGYDADIADPLGINAFINND